MPKTCKVGSSIHFLTPENCEACQFLNPFVGICLIYNVLGQNGNSYTLYHTVGLLQVDSSMAKIDSSIKEAAYHAWLGYYNSNRDIGRDKTTLVELANKFCESIGLQKPPALFRKTALKMGLKDIAGIRIRK